MARNDEEIADQTFRNAKGCFMCQKEKGLGNWGCGIYEGPMLPDEVDIVSYLLCPTCIAIPDITAQVEVKILGQIQGRTH